MGVGGKQIILTSRYPSPRRLVRGSIEISSKTRSMLYLFRYACSPCTAARVDCTVLSVEEVGEEGVRGGWGEEEARGGEDGGE